MKSGSLYVRTERNARHRGNKTAERVASGVGGVVGWAGRAECCSAGPSGWWGWEPEYLFDPVTQHPDRGILGLGRVLAPVLVLPCW